MNGVGEKRFTILKNKIGPYIINILFYLPVKAIDRFRNTSLRTIEHGSIITCDVEVVEINNTKIESKLRNMRMQVRKPCSYLLVAV